MISTLSRFIHMMVGGAVVMASLFVFGKVDASPTYVQTASIQPAVLGEANGGSSVISYQGRLLDPTTGQPKPDGAYTMVFNLYNVETGGTILWTETKNVATNKGLFTTLLGDTTLLAVEHFNGQTLYLGIAVGGDPEATPRQRVASVAYAIWSSTSAWADTLDGLDSTKFAAASHAHSGTEINDGTITADDLADGSGSSVDADLLDGIDSTAFAPANHRHSALPIAYATIQQDGVKATGTANVTSAWDAGGLRYVISITGENYFWLDYTTLVSPMSNCAAVRSTVGSVSGKLLIEFQNSANSNIQCYFQFVTFEQ